MKVGLIKIVEDNEEDDEQEYEDISLSKLLFVNYKKRFHSRAFCLH